MKFVIASGVSDQVRDHARRDHPCEACGLLIGSPGHVVRAEPTANFAFDPERGFEIDPAALLHWHRTARGEGLAVIGHYHSHPNGLARPSTTDAARAVEDGQLWVIVAADALTGWLRTATGFTSVELA